MTLGICQLSVRTIINIYKVDNVYSSDNGCRYDDSSRHFRNIQVQ